jgi:E3 ubiquitin-protein ligase BRE1
VELKEAIRIKEAEGDAYISDIEVSFFLSVLFLGMSKMYNICIQTIGQAYEDMQTQNQHLLQQLTDRDDFNIKVFISSLLFHFHVKAANS